MKEQTEEKQNLEISDVITRSEAFIEKNKKVILIVIAAIVVIILAIFGTKKWIIEPRNNHAAEEMFAAENYFIQQDYQKALEGDENHLGFNDIISDYKHTKSANLAHYYAGVCELRLGNYDEAVSHFKKYSCSDQFTAPLATMQQGDAAMESENTEQAISLYLKAAKQSTDYIVAPTALFKAGLAYIMQGEKDKAIDCFNQVKTKYPESTEATEMDKYIGYAENMQ